MPMLRLARYSIRPECLAACQQAQREIIASVREREPGTLLYTVAHEQDNPLSFVHCSMYADAAAFQQHLGNADMLARIQDVLEPAMTAPARFEQFSVPQEG